MERVQAFRLNPFLFSFGCMTLTLTQHTLEKLESLAKALGYKVRYEKGNFKTGACILEMNRVLIVNKFSSLESKIGSLANLLQNTEAEEGLLDDKQKSFFYQLKQMNIEF